MTDLKEEASSFLRHLGASRVHVADPGRGFERALKGRHPRELMPGANSVVVLITFIGFDYYRMLQFENNRTRLGHLHRDWLCYRLVDFFVDHGFHAVYPWRLIDESERIHEFSCKLAAYEAGLGVFGKCGIIITPEFGPRANIGAALTDAPLQPDGRLQDFSPCLNCSLCAKLCPVEAIDETLEPPAGFDRSKCLGFIMWLRRRTGTDDFTCGLCYNGCPAGTKRKQGIRFSKQPALVNLKVDVRRKLTREYTRLPLA